MAESAVESALLGIKKLCNTHFSGYMVRGAVTGIQNFIVQEAEFFGAVHGKIEELETEMKRIKCFLKDADRRQDENESVHGWVSEIRELAYDAEDAVATFIVEAASRRQEAGLVQLITRYALFFAGRVNIYRIGGEIDAIIAKMANLTSSLQTYGIRIKDDGEGSSSKTGKQELLRRSYSFSVEEDTFGLANDKQVLLAQLLEQHRKVISIYGMGGLGKTTLAGKLYHHNEVQPRFDAFAWVYVSQTFKASQVLEETLIKLTSKSRDDVPKMSDEEVAKKLYQIQQEKKCLVVLDDIWSNEDWNALKHAFPIEKIIGTILITTRSKPLGLHLHPRCFLHESQILSEEESWKLFQRKVDLHRTDSEDIMRMEILGREMVKKCSGLPLAIITLGGILATKKSINEWDSVHRNVGKYLRGGYKESSSLHGILTLSYSELPYHLKPCLLHLGQFPEDYSIPTTMLYRLWIAEGIVVNQPHGEETLEDIARGYLRELIDRCLVRVGEIGYCGRIKSCRLHVLIRDLALSKASQENYLQVIDGKTGYSEAHRLVAYKSTNNVMNFGGKNRVRSLSRSFDMKSLMVIGDFYMLRVLKIDNYDGIWIDEIGKLIHLKYLSIVECEVVKLPSSLGKLRYLETFILKTNSENLVTPEEFIWDSQELRHLTILLVARYGYNQGCRQVLIKLGNSRNLQTLCISGPIDVTGPIDVNDSNKLPNLQKLTTRFYNEKDLLKVVESGYLNGLATLSIRFRIIYLLREESMVLSESDLRKLLLACGQLKKLKLDGAIEQFPEYEHGFTPNLVKLVLDNSWIKKDPMPVLEKLPNLTWFQINNTHCDKMVCSSNGFPRLETLILHYMWDLVEWQVDEGAMASLRRLEIFGCGNLEMVPEGIKFINTLSLLKLQWMREQFNNRVRVIDGEEGEDYYKVRHVPSIIITDQRYDR